MGNTLLDSTSSDDTYESNTTNITFHNLCGSQIRFNSTKTRAKRIDGYCKAIVFSNRRIRPYEVVNIRIKQITSRWNGCIRIGFTSESLNNTQIDIPKTRYACPDLTNRHGFWARGIQETLNINDNVCFYFDTNSNIFYYVNNSEKKRLLISEIDITKTKLLYALVDIYGSVTEIELLGTNLNDNDEISHLIFNLKLNAECVNNFHHLYDNDFNESINNQKQVNKLASIEYPKQKLIHHLSNKSSSLKFNTKIKGNYVEINEKSQIAYRTSNDTCKTHGYVFIDGSLKKDESICFQLISIDNTFKHSDIKSLSFGVTNCRLDTLHSDRLPYDSYDLLDRKEYWIVYKNLLNDFKLYDEICLCLKDDGSISLSINGFVKNKCIFTIDMTQNLTYFLDICGCTNAVKLISPCKVSHKEISIQKQTKLEENETNDECVICLSSKTNCVFYTCGHMCACYDCALAFKNRSSSNPSYCPICREIIRDVVRCFRT